MKKFLLSFGLSALFLGAMAQDNAKPVGGTGPQISLDKEVHDYGTIANGANGTCEFIVTNTGDQPLIITNCKGSCGCTVPKCDTAPIKPGEKSVITVKYDTNRVGPINKSLTITSNAANTPKLPLGNAQPCGSLKELLGLADFVTLHVPDTELTRGMFGTAELAAMKPGAALINASRGMVVDLSALREALERGRLSGAEVDVFPSEPAKAGDVFDSPLRGLDNVILTPHIGGSTQEAQANIGREVASSLSAYLGTGSTTGCVTLPNIDAAPVRSGARILNVHRNVPGVLSAVNQLMADSQVNITGQSLATVESIGLLHVDVPLLAEDPKAQPGPRAS